MDFSDFKPVKILDDWSDSDYGLMILDAGGGPYIEYWDEPEPDSKEKYRIFRVEIEDDVTDHFDWANWTAIAKSSGISKKDIIKAGKDPEYKVRANVIRDLASEYGWHELDSYPLILTKKEMMLRWPDHVKFEE